MNKPEFITTIQEKWYKNFMHDFIAKRKFYFMAKYSKEAGRKVENAMHEMKEGELKTGTGKKVTSRKQAIAIGLSEARDEGAKVPKKRSSQKKGTAKKVATKKASTKKSSTKKSTTKKGSTKKSSAKKSSRKTSPAKS